MTKIEEVILQNQLILLKSVRTLIMDIDVETKQELRDRIIVTDTVLKIKDEINK